MLDRLENNRRLRNRSTLAPYLFLIAHRQQREIRHDNPSESQDKDYA
jgi:hypothetical protein